MFFIVLLAVILIACAPEKETKAKRIADELKQQEQIEVQEIIEGEQPPIAEPIQEIEGEQPQLTQELENSETLETEQTPEMPAEPTDISEDERTAVYQFFDKFIKNVDSYQFTYNKHKYFVRDKKYKIHLTKPITIRNANINGKTYTMFHYDVVYLDRISQKAIAYCESIHEELGRQCGKLEIYDIPYLVSYKDYNIILPEDWFYIYLNEDTDKISKGKYTLRGRSVAQAIFDQESPTVEMSFDERTGLALRVDKKRTINEEEILVERFDYEDFAYNSVRDKDIIHRNKDEIPTSEVFYKR